MHETTHVKQLHSVDTLLTELVCAICWFNPFVWLFRTEIRMNLEFLADKSVLSSGYGAEHYQLHLLSLSYNKAAVTITNNFNVSLLKKRIFMMNKKQTPNRSIFKYALIIPVIAILLLINCTSNKKEQKDNVTNIDPPKTEMKVDQQIKTDEANTDQQNAVVGTTDETKPVIHSQVEEMPKFPGGDAALMKWLSDSIAYPPSAQEKGIQGTVNLRFIVKPDGSVGDVELIKGLDPECDKAAISAVKKLPKFVPGKQNGVPVHVYFNMPVRFRLQQS